MTPESIYKERLASHRAAAAAHESRERVIAFARLAVIAIAILLAWRVSLTAAAIAVIAFIMLVFIHDSVIARRRKIEAAAAFCERGIDRLTNAWIGKGVSGEGLADEHHPFAADLDLFGKGSLFELICIAATAAGRSTLARWLLHPEAARRGDVIERQEAVGELRDRVELREAMAVLASEVTGEIEGAHLDEWANVPPRLTSRGQSVAAVAIACAAAVTFAIALPRIVGVFVAKYAPPAWSALWPLLLVILIEGVFSRMVVRAEVGAVTAEAERVEPALALLAVLMRRISREQFTSSRLAALRADLGDEASADIERLRRLVTWLDAARNQFFAPIASLLLWRTNFAFAIERWRRRRGAVVLRSIAAVGEIEALSSLASFAFEHPAFAMPEIVDGEPRFEAAAAGHPLIAEERRVANDVSLGGERKLLVISGSNMSGKSTMLRTIGVNAVLALAGAPACASRLRIAPMAVGASIRLHDSLQEGESRFYAEILRIRQIVAMAEGGAPLLFLLDEILHGTNSHDRRVGAEAVVRGLVQRGAIGCISTHDLALAAIADTMGPRAANVHFEDHLEEGVMRFDYRMRDGVVERSNALALMRTIGIEV